MKQRRILVTSALPYSNGHIHIGHLVEYIQTDIWVRFQKLRGHRCIYLCADDTHGTAIMLRARQEQRSEEELIAAMSEAHQRDFAGFQIAFDHYGSTNSEANRELCGQFWQALRKQKMVVEREVEQLFDTQAGTFLADRFVRGTCPRCKASDQPGDNCSSCGATYTPAELIEPHSTLSGSTPETRTATHLFVQVEQMHDWLAKWVQSGALQPEIANYLEGHFLGQPLRDWDISRPEPYFGFEIPDAPGHYWYVWFDAPIGYLAATKEWCDKNFEEFETWWRDKVTEVHHFIGKDIAYFHTLFWPAMLKVAGFNLPNKVRVHGFLTVDGEKMSKSKGTFITAATYLQHLDPSYLRYYYATKVNDGVDDLDLNLDELVAKINSDLVGKVVNLASRTARFVQDTGLATHYGDDGGLFTAAASAGDDIATAYERGDFNQAMRQIMALADRANEYVEHAKPWELRKDESKTDELCTVCTVALNLFRQLAIYLSPVLPQLAKQAGDLLNRPIKHWDDAQEPLVGTQVSTFKHLLQRVDPAKVQAMIEATREADADPQAAQRKQAEAERRRKSTDHGDENTAISLQPLADPCDFDDFMKVDLRVARIIAAEDVPEAKKLLKVTVSLGDENHPRTIFAGIKAAYRPEDLVGRLVIIVANLAPKKMRFGTSEGMILAAGPGGKDIHLITPDDGAQPGQRVR